MRSATSAAPRPAAHSRRRATWSCAHAAAVDVVAKEGRARLALDDLSEALTFALRGAAKSLAGGGRLERRRLRALMRARR